MFTYIFGMFVRLRSLPVTEPVPARKARVMSVDYIQYARMPPLRKSHGHPFPELPDRSATAISASSWADYAAFASTFRTQQGSLRKLRHEVRQAVQWESPVRRPMGSLAPGACQPDLDAPRRHLGVFFLALEVELGRPDVGVAGELPHFVHRRPVADRVVDRRCA